MRLLASLFGCAHTTPTLAVQLAECRGALLTAERRAAKLTIDLDATAGHFLRASRRAEAMTSERDGLRELLATKEVTLAQVVADWGEVAARCGRLETELVELTSDCRDLERARDNLTDIADGLQNELKAVKAKKKGRA